MRSRVDFAGANVIKAQFVIKRKVSSGRAVVAPSSCAGYIRIRVHLLVVKRIHLLPLLGAIAVVAAPAPGRALTTVCTADWTASQDQSAGGTLAGASPPCPASAITATISPLLQGGKTPGSVEAFNWGNIFATNYPATTNIGIAIGASNPGVTRTLTFSQAVTNPFIYASYLDGTSEQAKSVFLFGQPFILVQASNAQVDPANPNKVVAIAGSAHNRESDGFVVQMQGTFTSVSFEYQGFNFPAEPQYTDTVLFTAGIASDPVPGPLPLMGAGVAFGFSRRLRRRIRSRV